MIGGRSVLAGLIVAVMLVPVLGAGGPGPARDLAARHLVATRAAAADAALADLETALAPALDAARRGSAGLVDGTPSPGDRLATAGQAAEEAEDEADGARRALDGLRGALLARGQPRDVAAPAASGELASIGAQLGGTAAAADAFAAQRDRATGLVERLAEALVALESDDLARAETLVAEAKADHDALAAWQIGVVTLPVWLETTDALIDALERLLRAVRDGDGAAGGAAARDVARLADEAATADRALRIAIAEGASGVAAAPLARLADVMRGIDEARSAVASILQTVGR